MDRRIFQKVATVISILGHPLLLMAITANLIAFHLYDLTRAVVVASVIIVIVIVPVTVHLVLKTRRSTYTNFDVSDRKQRESFYRFGLVSLGLATGVLYFLPGANKFFTGTLYAFLMIVRSAFVNLKIKASLHTSVAVYVAFSCSIFDAKLAAVMLAFAIIQVKMIREFWAIIWQLIATTHGIQIEIPIFVCIKEQGICFFTLFGLRKHGSV